MNNTQWTVGYEADVKEQIAQHLASGKMSQIDIGIIMNWVTSIEEDGLEATQMDRQWRDHDLSGEWKGHRAISFSYEGRLVYRTEGNILTVTVVKISPNHDYRR